MDTACSTPVGIGRDVWLASSDRPVWSERRRFGDGRRRCGGEQGCRGGHHGGGSSGVLASRQAGVHPRRASGGSGASARAVVAVRVMGRAPCQSLEETPARFSRALPWRGPGGLSLCCRQRVRRRPARSSRRTACGDPDRLRPGAFRRSHHLQLFRPGHGCGAARLVPGANHRPRHARHGPVGTGPAEAPPR
jgi:hypothetical protein